jgi:hypothetical protein
MPHRQFGKKRIHWRTRRLLVQPSFRELTIGASHPSQENAPTDCKGRQSARSGLAGAQTNTCAGLRRYAAAEVPAPPLAPRPAGNTVGAMQVCGAKAPENLPGGRSFPASA